MLVGVIVAWMLQGYQPLSVGGNMPTINLTKNSWLGSLTDEHTTNILLNGLSIKPPSMFTISISIG